MLYWSASLTATAGVNVAPALVTAGASCWSVRVRSAGEITRDRLVEVRPGADAMRVLLPALVMTRSLKEAEPFASELLEVVPLAKVPFVRPIEISTPLVATLLLN